MSGKLLISVAWVLFFGVAPASLAVQVLQTTPIQIAIAYDPLPGGAGRISIALPFRPAVVPHPETAAFTGSGCRPGAPCRVPEEARQ
jgi:hypothetical protein